MKRLFLGKSVTIVLAASVILLLLSACSGVVGGDNGVLISVPRLAGSSASRYVSDNAKSGYVVVLKKGETYSPEEFAAKEHHPFNFNEVKNQVYIADLPVGDYIFVIALMDANDWSCGLAIKEVSIKEGFNDVETVVGPGISTFEIAEGATKKINIGDPFKTSWEPDERVKKIGFAEDTMIFYFNPGIFAENRANVNTDLVLTFGSGKDVLITGSYQIGGKQDGDPIGVYVDENGASVDYSAKRYVSTGNDADGVKFVVDDEKKGVRYIEGGELLSPDNTNKGPFTYNIKWKD